MALQLQVNGDRFSKFISAEVERSLDAVAGAFRFTAAGVLPKDVPFKIGDSCQVIVTDSASKAVGMGLNLGDLLSSLPGGSGASTVIDGYLESVQVSATGNSHTVTFEGRDKVADLVDSQILPGKSVSVKAHTPILAALNASLHTMGLGDFKVASVNGAGTGFSTKIDRSAQTGDSVLGFLVDLAAEVPAVLTGSTPGSLSLEVPGSRTADIALTNLVKEDLSNPNNLKQLSFTRDVSGLFSEYHAFREKIKGLVGSATTDPVTTHVSDDTIRKGRTLVIHKGTASVRETAQWSLNRRKALSTRYSCTVRGHFSDPGFNTPWTPGQLVTVNDDFAGLEGVKMLLTSVRFVYGPRLGSVTELTLTGQGLFDSQPPLPGLDMHTGYGSYGYLA